MSMRAFPERINYSLHHPKGWGPDGIKAGRSPLAQAFSPSFLIAM
jgi:hypothetical protein